MSRKIKTFLVLFIMTAAITLTLGRVLPAEASVSNTQNLNNTWSADSTNGFVGPSASDALDSSANAIWIDNGDTSAQWIEFSVAPGEGLFAFDLTSLTLGKYESDWDMTFTIVGTKTDSSITTPVILSWPRDGSTEKTFSGADFSGLTGLTKFKVSFGDGTFPVWYAEFRQFAIANQVNSGNAAPVITALSDITFPENTVNAVPQQIDPDIAVADSDSPNFDGGQVTVAYDDAGLAEDQLTVGNIGSISVSGNAVNYAGAGQIGTVSGGTNGNPLLITLNASATPARVTELLQALAYRNTSNEPTSYRTISITVSDGDGGTSTAVTARIGVSGQAESGVENPALTQDLCYPVWVDNLNNGFAIAANGSVTLAGNGTSIWINGGDSGPASLTISAAEQFAGGKFDLTGLAFDLVNGTYTVTVTGHKAGGGTVTASATGNSTAAFNAINLSAMTGLDSFDVEISGSGDVSNLGLDSFTIANPGDYTGNQAPGLTGLSDITFQENTVNAAPQQIDPDVAVTDSDSPDFDGGQVTVSYTAGSSAQDQLTVGNIGNISVSGNTVNYTGVGQIGTVSGGSNGTALVITLNANAIPARVTDLLRALAYGNTSNEPTSYRTISITISDGDGGTSVAATAKIGVSGQAESGVEAPALSQNLSYPVWVDDLNNGFAITPNGSVTLAGDGSLIWIEGGGNGPASLSISAAEQFAGGMFDLTGMTFNLNGSITYTVTVKGYKALGGTEIANAIGNSTAMFNLIDLSAMTGLTSFEVQISGDGNVSNLALDAFTITNPQACNLPPVFTSTAAFSVPETVQADNAVLHDVQAHDGDGGGNDANLTYSIAGGTGQSYFTINASTGEITLSAAGEAALDYESASSYTLTVRADDGRTVNNISEQTVTVSVGDIAPVITAGQIFTVSETAANGTAVGTVANTGDDDSVTFTITGGNTGSAFALDATSGAISVNDADAIDYEDASSFTLTIQATDGTNNPSQDVTVNVENVNDPPTVSMPASVTVIEDVATPITGVAIADVDAGANDVMAVFTVNKGTLSASSGGGVSVGGTAAALTLTGTVTGINDFISGGNLNFTTALNDTSSVTLGVKANDQGHTGAGGAQESATSDIMINVTSVNDPPSFAKGSDQAVAANSGPQQITGWATNISSGPVNESTQMITFTVIGNDNPGLFSVPPQVSSAGDLNYTPAANTTGNAAITIQLTDNGGTDNGGIDSSAPQSFNIKVYAANGSGTMAVTPDIAAIGQTGLTLCFTYTAAAGGLENGAVSINVPDGWSLPSTAVAAPGYTTASAGTVSVSGRALTVTGLTLAANNTITITYGDKSGGGPGATAASITGASSWQAQSRTTAAGSPVNLGVSPQITVGSNVTIDPASGSAIEGESSQYEVSLVYPPVTDVVISVTPDSQVSVDRSSLTFGSANYNTPQTVTATAIDNHLADGDRTGTITHAAGSADPAYQGISVPDFLLNITDNDGPDIIISPSSSPLQITEGGAAVSYTMVLATLPADSVTVYVYGGQQISIDPQMLEFTAGNWDVPREVAITAVDDVDAEGPHTVTVTHSVYSTDPDYSGFHIPDITVDITDNDSPGISIDQSGGAAVVSEGGGDYSYTLVLTTRPYADVEIGISGGAQLNVDPGEWIFTAGNWNTPKTIRVEAMDDDVAEGEHIGTVSHSVYSADPGYNNYTVSPLTLLIIDNDASANATLSGLVLSSGTLTPVFDPATGNYNLAVAYSVDSITVTPFPADGNATVTVNSAPVTGGQSSPPVSLNVGANSINIAVTAQDGITVRIYTVTVNRAAPSDDGDSPGENTQPPGASTSAAIKANTGGQVSLEDAAVEIPAGVLPADATVSIRTLSQSEANRVVPEGMRVKMAGVIYEITASGERQFGDNYITIRLAYNPVGIAEGESPAIHYYDEMLGRWIKLETQLVQEDDRWYALTRVNHLTKFAVFSTAATPETPPDDKKVVILTLGQTLASIDGTPYTLDASPYVDKPSQRTLVPIRFVSEALGAKVEWDAALRQVTVRDKAGVIVLTLGSTQVLVDGTEQTMECAPELLPPGRVFVPLRFVFENLGAQVDYDNDTGKITITR